MPFLRSGMTVILCAPALLVASTIGNAHPAGKFWTYPLNAAGASTSNALSSAPCSPAPWCVNRMAKDAATRFL